MLEKIVIGNISLLRGCQRCATENGFFKVEEQLMELSGLNGKYNAKLS